MPDGHLIEEAQMAKMYVTSQSPAHPSVGISLVWLSKAGMTSSVR